MKAEVEKLEMNKLVNVPTSWNNFKIKVDDLDVDKLKTALVEFTKSSDVVGNQAFKNAKLNTLKTKVNNSKKKKKKRNLQIPDVVNSIHINQNHPDKQNLEKKNWRCW